MNFSNIQAIELSFYLGNRNEKDNKFYFINKNEEGEFPILDIGELSINILNYDLHIWANKVENSKNQEPIEFIVNIIKSTKKEYGEPFSILLNNWVIDLLTQLNSSENYEDFFSDLYKDMKIDSLYKKHYGKYPNNKSTMKEIFFGFVPYIGTYINLYKIFLESFLNNETSSIDIINEIFPSSLSMGYKILPKIDIEDNSYFFQEFFTVDSLINLSMFEVLKIIERKIHINKCENCGKYFITKSKSNEKYCDNIYKNRKNM